MNIHSVQSQQSQIDELNRQRGELLRVIAALDAASVTATLIGESTAEFDSERREAAQELCEVDAQLSRFRLNLSTSDVKDASAAYMQTCRDFQTLAKEERAAISQLRQLGRSWRQIKQEERKFARFRQALKEQASRQESHLKGRFGLTDFDLTVLRKRTESQPEIARWLE